MKSRQEIAYDRWQETFFKLVAATKDVPNKQDLAIELHELMELPILRQNLIQAFSNFMWGMDEQIEALVAEELNMVLEMIPLIADPDNENTQKILAAFRSIIGEASAVTETIDEDEIDNLVTEDEYDNTRPSGL